MANYFGFLDDTGVLANDPHQRFFGLGLLRIEDTAPFYQEMLRARERAVSKLSSLTKPFEFKFNKINQSNYTFYCELIEAYFSFPENCICIFMIDKFDKNFNFNDYFPSIWDAYIGYSKLIIKNNLEEVDKICVIADFHQKPISSTKHYESEVRNCNMSQIYNVCMIESHASLYIQIVDVLLGAVGFDFKCSINTTTKPNAVKKSVVDLVKEKLKVGSLARSFTVRIPNYFSVWKFKPNKKAGCQRS